MNYQSNLPIRHRIGWGVLASLLPILISPAQAAPGTLPQSPLFLSTQAQPNIMLLFDDSGSMDWEITTQAANSDGRFIGTQPDGTSPAGSGSVTHRNSDEADDDAECGFPNSDYGGDFDGYIYIVEFNSNSESDNSNDCNTADEQAWRARNSDFNPLYFDPSKTYEPWIGLDSDGIPFTDVPITQAPDNPYDPVEYIDLTVDNSNWLSGIGTNGVRGTSDRDNDNVDDGFRYYTWNDTDNDGLFDDGEETEHLIKDQDAATKQNFANWFSYYRKREFVAKAAYGSMIASASNVRMGLVTINNNSSVNTAIAAMNSDPTSGNKKALLDALYSINSSSSTPLRAAFENCSKYLDCDTTHTLGFSTCPALSQTDGGSCQQNFIIAMTDGYYNSSSFTYSNTDGDNNTSWDSSSAGPYGDAYSNTLADIAMNYYENDLHPTLPDLVPTVSGVDEAPHQHVVTYTVGFGVNGTLSAMPPNDTDPFAWPDPDIATQDRKHRIDDLRHAAWNGRGQYLDASDPSILQQALEDAISSIADRIGTSAAVTFNTGTLSSGSVVYLSLFNSNGWSGQLFGFPLDGLTGSIDSNPIWEAGEELDNRSLTTNPRTILTYNGTDGVAFDWTNLTDNQKNDLCKSPSGSDCTLVSSVITDAAGIAQARLDFLRGDRSNEGNDLGFRIRSSRLGDFVHSGPVFVGAPGQSWPDTAPFPTATGERYSDFKSNSTVKSRTKVLYLGGNDGMLHGFDADTGEELLGYIPEVLFSNASGAGLHYLTDPGYVHRFYVDLNPTVSDAYVKTTTAGTAAWKTVLVGGLRGGGRGYFALDITDPAVFTETATDAADVVMWEFTSNDDTDLGYSYGSPRVVLLENGRWAAIFGNGYEDTGSGIAKLFIVYLDGGLDGTWTANTDYLKISTGAGSSSSRNGIATVAVVDTDGNGAADRVYGGDLQGKLWAFDLSSTNDSQWKSAYKSGSNPAPLFTANTNQPITVEPIIVNHPTVTDTTNNQPNLLVLFGTGQYLVDGDKTTTNVQSFYGVWDKGTSALTRSELVAQTLSNAPSTTNVRLITDNAVDYEASGGNAKYGWYVDLSTGLDISGDGTVDTSAERVVVRPVARRDNIFFNTMLPKTDVCDYGGAGWLMSISIENGGSPETTPFDLNGDDVIGENDMITITDNNGDETLVSAVGTLLDIGIPAQSGFLGDRQYTPHTGDESGSENSDGDEGNRFIDDRRVEDVSGQFGGRVSWEELINE